jgi:hypothetical protein
MGVGARPRRIQGGRLAALLSVAPPVTPYGVDFSAYDLHVDGDQICPRCLDWISPADIVRRTAYGPAQHEVCPHRSM